MTTGVPTLMASRMKLRVNLREISCEEGKGHQAQTVFLQWLSTGLACSSPNIDCRGIIQCIRKVTETREEASTYEINLFRWNHFLGLREKSIPIRSH